MLVSTLRTTNDHSAGLAESKNLNGGQIPPDQRSLPFHRVSTFKPLCYHNPGAQVRSEVSGWSRQCYSQWWHREAVRRLVHCVDLIEAPPPKKNEKSFIPKTTVSSKKKKKPGSLLRRFAVFLCKTNNKKKGSKVEKVSGSGDKCSTTS